MSLLRWRGDDDASQLQYAASFLTVPAQMQSQASGAVERMLFMSYMHLLNSRLVTATKDPWSNVVAGSTDTQDSEEMLPPSWVDLIQDG